MDDPHTLLVELRSQVERLEVHARKFRLDIVDRDFDVAVSLISILEILKDEKNLVELFAYSQHGVEITTLFSRAYVVLVLMYLNYIDLLIETEASAELIETETYARMVVKHIRRVLKKYAWQL